ncbi:disulfide bond formation protein DsbA [Sulfitobacter sp. EhC04]|uniref:disulfide bond formation protein DsbA n=1 Tax=Sulfitobacter sp. EhC04 TaxID=1849168 RepID=UPI001F43A713|nr:disulfide bond formation protein DsbA [Sulfitobacter sp. EhC04]
MHKTLMLAAFLAAGPGWAESDIFNLTAAERAAFRAEIRALLLAEPQIVDRALNPQNPAAQEIRQEIEDDQQLLRALETEILVDRQIALFIGTDCAECTRAVNEMRAISKDYGATFTLHDVANPTSAALAERLGMADLPFYVLPGMILRGHIPPVVLRRYLG